MRGELPRHQLAHLGIRNRIGQLPERLERLLRIAGPQHLLGVLEEPAPRVHLEALRGAEPSEPEVQLGAPRHAPQRFAAQRDRVVVESRVRVPVRRLLVVADRFLHTPQPQVEVAHPVVQGQLRLPLPLVSRTQHLEIELDRLLPFLSLLVQARLVLQLDDRLHFIRTRRSGWPPPGAASLACRPGSSESGLLHNVMWKARDESAQPAEPAAGCADLTGGLGRVLSWTPGERSVQAGCDRHAPWQVAPAVGCAPA